MRLLALLLAPLAAWGQVLTFAPQEDVTSRVALWSVAGCPGRPISITTIYALASVHGVPWMQPKTAERLFQKKSAWSWIIRATGFAAAGGGALMTFDVIRANQAAKSGMLIGGALITVLLPLAQREVPRLDPAAGLPLLVGTDGCGQTSFYAHPSAVPGFLDMVSK